MGIIHAFKGKDGDWDWEGVPLESYGPQRPGVSVRRFISRRDGSKNLEVRYFELQPGATTNLESHNYEHTVLVLRGRGSVRLGDGVFPIRLGDAIFVEPDEIHQFQAGAGETLGFMCAVLDRELRTMVHGEQRLSQYRG